MNAIRFFLKKVLYPASAIFTVTWLLICGIIDAVSDMVNINFSSGLMCFFIALAIASCNLILTRNSIAPIGRYFLHLLLSIVSISVIVALFSTTFKTKYTITGNSFYLVLILIVLYLLIVTPFIVWYFKKNKNKSQNKKEDYQSIFQK